jgi:hypothetical protein
MYDLSLTPSTLSPHLPKIQADVTLHNNPYITYIDERIFGIRSLIIGAHSELLDVWFLLVDI